MLNVILIHGYNGIPSIYHWLKHKLEQEGYFVIMPEFPLNDSVEYSKWSEILDNYQNIFNAETIVVAHSIGNEFIMKYLTKKNTKIKLSIGLAGFCEYFETENRKNLAKALKEFLVTDKEIEHFKRLTAKRYCIYSDSDHLVPFNILENYPKRLEAKSILLKGVGHMDKKSGIETIPEVLEIIKKEKENYFILHGSFGSPYSNWFPWLYDFLKEDKKDVYVPSFPIGIGRQNYKNWSTLLKYYLDLDLINENTTIIANSIAPVFICKFLIEHQIRIKKLISVCGFNNYLGINEEYDTVNQSMYLENLEEIKQYANEMICFYSDNDPYVKQEAEEDFANKIATEKILLPNAGHINLESGYDTFEEIVTYL